MIIFDSSNFRSGSNVPEVEGCVTSDILEDITGADCLLSPLDMPAGKPALIREHIANRALLVQLKIGLDLASSVGNRLRMSLAKMRESGASPQQRWLVFCGTLACDKEGKAIIDGRAVSEHVPGVNYWACDSAIVDWQLRGGQYKDLSRVTLLPDWLKRREESLLRLLVHPTINAMPDMPTFDIPDDNDPFQIVKRAPRGLIILSYLLGEATGLAVWEKCDQSLMWALDYLTDTSPKRTIGLMVGGKKVNEGNLKKKALSVLGGLPGQRLEVLTQSEVERGSY